MVSDVLHTAGSGRQVESSAAALALPPMTCGSA